MHAAEAERLAKMETLETISLEDEMTWMLEGRFLADRALEALESPTSHLDTERLQSGRNLVEAAVDEKIHGGELAGADPKVRQFISDGALLAYNEWATRSLVFSEEAQHE